MKQISVSKKLKVVKLFFSGLSYDEIAQQTGVAKGSVVNIIDDFRYGILQAPPDMAEFSPHYFGAWFQIDIDSDYRAKPGE